jgi:putative component of membrane protein insertase Oxa1/YidC/SpoIIIJ protein YidD
MHCTALGVRGSSEWLTPGQMEPDTLLYLYCTFLAPLLYHYCTFIAPLLYLSCTFIFYCNFIVTSCHPRGPFSASIMWSWRCIIDCPTPPNGSDLCKLSRVAPSQNKTAFQVYYPPQDPMNSGCSKSYSIGIVTRPT